MALASKLRIWVPKIYPKARKSTALKFKKGKLKELRALPTDPFHQDFCPNLMDAFHWPWRNKIG
jgi:hypothetical protein